MDRIRLTTCIPSRRGLRQGNLFAAAPREEAWRLLASALYRTGRQGDALAAVGRARELLREQLGLDPGPRLRRLEADLLRQADPGPASNAAERVWAAAAAAYDQTVPAVAPSRLDSTVLLLRDLALTGPPGLEAAREQWSAAVAAAEQTSNPDLIARVVGRERCRAGARAPPRFARHPR